MKRPVKVHIQQRPGGWYAFLLGRKRRVYMRGTFRSYKEAKAWIDLNKEAAEAIHKQTP